MGPHLLAFNCEALRIETLAQLDAVRTLGVDSGQGYLFSRPLPAEEADAFIDNQRATTTDQPESLPKYAELPMDTSCDPSPIAESD